MSERPYHACAALAVALSAARAGLVFAKKYTQGEKIPRHLVLQVAPVPHGTVSAVCAVVPVSPWQSVDPGSVGVFVWFSCCLRELLQYADTSVAGVPSNV